jgi:hypothetical protein
MGKLSISQAKHLLFLWNNGRKSSGVWLEVDSLSISWDVVCEISLLFS